MHLFAQRTRYSEYQSPDAREEQGSCFVRKIQCRQTPSGDVWLCLESNKKERLGTFEQLDLILSKTTAEKIAKAIIAQRVTNEEITISLRSPDN